jgi:hypothetical protein
MFLIAVSAAEPACGCYGYQCCQAWKDTFGYGHLPACSEKGKGRVCGKIQIYFHFSVHCHEFIVLYMREKIVQPSDALKKQFQ